MVQHRNEKNLSSFQLWHARQSHYRASVAKYWRGVHAPQTAVSLNAWFCLQLLNIRYPFPPSTIFCLHVGGVTQPGAGEGIILLRIGWIFNPDTATVTVGTVFPDWIEKLEIFQFCDCKVFQWLIQRSLRLRSVKSIGRVMLLQYWQWNIQYWQ